MVCAQGSGTELRYRMINLPSVECEISEQTSTLPSKHSRRGLALNQATRPLKQPHATLLLPHAPNHLALPTYTNPPVTSSHHLLISVTSVMSYKCRALWHTEGRGSSHTPLRLKVLAAG
ncbi:unnamed protein product [Leuciscus chuanchicus]